MKALSRKQMSQLVAAQAAIVQARALLVEVYKDVGLDISDRIELQDIAGRLDGALVRVEGDKSTGLMNFLIKKRAGGTQ